MKYCIACGMPLDGKQVCWNSSLESDSCVFCTNHDWTIKSCNEIFEWWVEFFVQAAGVDRDLWERIVRKNMNQLDYWKWKKCECLQGIEATQEEFDQAMKKLS